MSALCKTILKFHLLLHYKMRRDCRDYIDQICNQFENVPRNYKIFTANMNI